MKLVSFKFYYIDSKYYLIISFEKLIDKNKIIEHETNKIFESKLNLLNYLNQFNILNDYKKARVLVDYFTDEIIIESMLDKKELLNKQKVKNELLQLYPNVTANYDLKIITYELKNKMKVYLSTLIHTKEKEDLREICSCIPLKKIYYGFNLTLLQEFILKNFQYFNKKYLLLIQKEGCIWKFYKINEGYIIDYFGISTSNSDYKFVINKLLHEEFGGGFDEIIYEGPYNIYLAMVDNLLNYKVSYLDYLEKLKNLDERKILYAKKFK